MNHGRQTAAFTISTACMGFQAQDHANEMERFHDLETLPTQSVNRLARHTAAHGDSQIISAPGFGRHQPPVGIAAAQGAGERPDVGDIDHAFRITINNLAGPVAGGGDQF